MTSLRRAWSWVLTMYVVTVATGLHAATIKDAATPLRFATLAPSPTKCPLESTSATAFAKGVSERFAIPPVIDNFCYRDTADLPRAVGDVLAIKPPAVVVWASIAAVQLLHEKAPSLPIVFVNIPDPVGSGLVASLARPGGAVTGITNASEDVLAKRVELLREALPTAKRLGVLCDRDDPRQADSLRVTESAGRRFGFDPRVYSVTSAADLEKAFSSMRSDAIDAIVIVPNIFFFLNRQDVVANVNRIRVPTMYFTTTFQDLGGLFIYSSNLDDLSYRAAALVYKVLRGTSPADIPVEQPIKFDFIVNMKTARELGVTVPPSVLLRASTVVER